MKIEMNKQKALSCLYSVFTAVAIVALAVFAVLFTSCRTIKEVPVEKVVERTEYIDRLQTDSVYCHDSVYVRDAGDTIYLYKDKYIYKYKFVRDTAYICRVDSVPYVIEVEQRLTGWENIKNEWGGYSMLLLLIIVVLIVVYIVRKIVRF